jgi:uncharacterized membrane protein
VARLGHAGFGIAYTDLSLALLAWLIAAAGRAPYVPLWDWVPRQSWHDLRAALSECPVSLSVTTDTLLRSAAGLMLYAGLIWLHPPVIGVDPLV